MRLFVAVFIAVVALVLGVAPALANPTGTQGQPNQSCEDQPSTTPGFGTGGFANAEEHYAGEGPGSTNANSTSAVSQYDVACFQVSQR
jgi:hypothetical protein